MCAVLATSVALAEYDVPSCFRLAHTTVIGGSTQQYMLVKGALLGWGVFWERFKNAINIFKLNVHVMF